MKRLIKKFIGKIIDTNVLRDKAKRKEFLLNLQIVRSRNSPKKTDQLLSIKYQREFDLMHAWIRSKYINEENKIDVFIPHLKEFKNLMYYIESARFNVVLHSFGIDALLQIKEYLLHKEEYSLVKRIHESITEYNSIFDHNYPYSYAELIKEGKI